jgi:hypothetical protein
MTELKLISMAPSFSTTAKIDLVAKSSGRWLQDTLARYRAELAGHDRR